MLLRRNLGLALSILALACGCRHPAAPAAEQSRRYGELMTDVGRRFERSGRAVLASRWDLASYDLDEIAEAFEDDFPNARTPADVRIDLRPQSESFARTHLPALRQAVLRHDRAAFMAAYANSAATCNNCHQSAGKNYIEIPSSPGHEVPLVSASTDANAGTTATSGVAAPDASPAAP